MMLGHIQKSHQQADSSQGRMMSVAKESADNF
jgi:hypothetical protein